MSTTWNSEILEAYGLPGVNNQLRFSIIPKSAKTDVGADRVDLQSWLGPFDSIEHSAPNAEVTPAIPLVSDLLREAPIALSLVGIVDSRLTGHVIFTTCSVVGSSGEVALLGPLAVAPTWQRQGIGSAIVRAGLRRLEDAGVSQVYVLGDPAYYGRHGFLPESYVKPPYPLPTNPSVATPIK